MTSLRHLLIESPMAKDKGSKSGKKNTSLRLDSKTLKALKIKAIEEDTSIQKIIERLIKNYLDEDKIKK